MRFTHYLYIVPLMLLTACSSDEQIDTAVETTDNGPIVLAANIVEGDGEAVTRAGAEDNHASHLTLTTNTALALQVSGTWTSSSVIKATTGTIGGVATGTDGKHNEVSCNPTLYWDDYGTADPANAATGRADGLTIYGAAINSKTTTTIPAALTAPTTSGWTINWTLPTDQSVTTPADKDLLISNNVKAGTGDGTYKFADRASGKLLEFKHAMSKITVNLKAGAGFTGSAFAATPTVILTSNNATSSNTEWAKTTCNVNVTNGTIAVHSSLSSYTPSTITMADAASVTANYNATKEALVVPGSEFTADNAIIAKITADGNIYYVTAEKIRTAISANHSTDGAYLTEAGKNYIINVTVNKTDIVVTATVTNWSDVTAAEVTPVINVNASWGADGGTATTNSFKFYRSTSLDTGYSGDATVSYSSPNWTMSPQLYWPNHNTHYQFRGVVPLYTTGSPSTAVDPTVTTTTHGTKEYEVIQVSNTAYKANYFPSDLQIARPEIDAATYCTNTESGHTQTLLYSGGICATEGTINLNFRYMMSQVEVNLSTTTGSDAVELTNAKVEIVNVHKTADVTLGSREVITTGTQSATPVPATDTFGDYTLDPVTGSGNENKRLSAIVPQTLTYTTAQASGNVKFRITITNTNGTPSDTSDDTTDVYYADVEPILETGQSTKVAPNGKWESGVHYVYNLKLRKTDISVTATLATWTTVTASPDVWF